LRAAIVGILLAGAILGASADVVVGNGRVLSELRSLSSFTSIRVEGSGSLRVHRGRQRVEITSDSNILPYISTSVSGDELCIGFKPFTSVINARRTEYDITLPELSALRISGSGDAYLDSFSGESFAAVASGSGGIKAELAYGSVELLSSGSGGFDAVVKASRLRLRCTGSGSAFLRGSADKAEVQLSGSGSLGARELSSLEARVAMSGSGGAEIKAARSLEAELSGSGSLRYWGSPELRQRVSGSGRVARAGS
jgi:hypothetical protein